ncbi:MAG: hypothetical protein EXX96DRAFT_605487 [Benjaminiella poitrasii]|nr:MAG: hypothetical protein EXX96DRAFT_605487 [Benjaminiella poitrasii]
MQKKPQHCQAYKSKGKHPLQSLSNQTKASPGREGEVSVTFEQDANKFESLFIESSSGLLQENISHTLEDTLKLLVECNGALCYILSHFKNSRFKTVLKKPTFGVQVIKDRITLSKMNLKEEEYVDMELKKESSGLTIVPKEETLAALLGSPEF